MPFDVVTIFFTFTFFSILGWILEVIYRSVHNKSFVNPGLLKGPYLPLYGTGALILITAVSMLHEANILTKAVIYFIITTGLELVSGLASERFFHTRLWDYSNQKFNYKGYICLKFSLYWLLLAFAFEYLILPSYYSILALLSPIFKWVVAGVTILVMLIDFLVILIKRFFRLTLKEKALVDEEFANMARPILELPEIAKLAQYKHHREKNRLDHVKEVAYLSFIFGKKLSLDGEAIVRGALLHDLFYYDWLHEGPRLHAFRHHSIALENARNIIYLTEKEADIIKKHMWPLTIVPPRYMESLIVSIVDTFCSVRDYLRIKKCNKLEKVLVDYVDSKTGDKERNDKKN